MNNRLTLFSLIAVCLLLLHCKPSNNPSSSNNTRQVVDTIGFAHYGWQVDSIVSRISQTYPNELEKNKIDQSTSWRVAICPHDDYTYASWHYPNLLKNIKAKTIIIFGVAHKARQLNISDQIVFDSYSYWHGPYKSIKVSPIREELTASIPKELYIVSDSLQKIEHSVESMLPFLQYYDKDVEIISILVPFMNTDRMTEISKPLASALVNSMKKHNLEWGKDIAILITTDAVHYGDEDWGGKNMAPFGVDSVGYKKAIAHEHGIIDTCLSGEPTIDKINKFIDYTVQKENYKEYRWTWCGRYSLPLGLFTALEMQNQLKSEPLQVQYADYSNSIDHNALPVDDLQMGKTAIANARHWVGYASVGYK